MVAINKSMPCSLRSSATIPHTPAPSGIDSLAVERSTKRHDRMNTDEADKDTIKRENPSYIEFKDNSNCKHRCPGRERQPGIASPSGDNNHHSEQRDRDVWWW
jgi:hypothetical protein